MNAIKTNRPILVTGAAGFLGMHVSRLLLDNGYEVIGIDEMNSYYLPHLKQARLSVLGKHLGFKFRQLDVSDALQVKALFDEQRFDYVIHLAAQAGVRFSIDDPFAYQRSNLAGMTSILEAARHAKIKHLLYASSSSVYGGNTKVPFKESDPVELPQSFYAATKRANELMALSYSHLFGLHCTALRFFTVYGPWGRPDMAYWKFTEAMLRGEEIKVFGGGLLSRDFTCYSDIVESICRLIALAPSPEASLVKGLPHRILNIGNNQPQTVNTLIELLERIIGRPASRKAMAIPPGDVLTTYADCTELERLTGFKPRVSLHDGLREFVQWYRQFFSI